MSKQEFVNELIKSKDALGINTTKQASLIFDCFINILKDKIQHLQEGQHFRLHGIGSFYPRQLKALTVRDPNNGKMLNIPPRKKLRFRFYKSSNLT